MQLKSVSRFAFAAVLCCLALILMAIGRNVQAHSPQNLPFQNHPVQNQSGPKKEPKPRHRIRPWITIDHAPKIPAGPEKTGPISGHVGGIRGIRGLAVVLWAKGDGKWYVQPTTAAPYTPINSGQSFTFSNDTHGEYYAALLVLRAKYHPAGTLNNLPEVDGRTILAATKSGPK